MSVTYTPLNQGQGDDRRNESNNVNSSSSAPMAGAEIDDMDDEHKTAKNISDSNVPHVVVTEANPQDEKYNHVGDEFDRTHINIGDLRPHTPQSSVGRVPHFGLNYEAEIGSIMGETIPDINVYQHKKTLAQGMMDLALFSANANQLRYVLDSYARHPYYWPSVISICLSLGFQVAIGIGLIWNALYNVKDEKEICIANKINNWCVIGIFLVVVINVFVSAFGVADPPPTATAPILVTPVTRG